MPKINTRVTFRRASVVARIQAASKEALFAVGTQALQDSNQYCPEDQGDLLESSIVSSDFKVAILKWATAYARYQYYGVAMEGRAPKIKTDRPLKYTKPDVHKMWAHHARSVHSNEWKAVYQAELRRLMKK